MAVDMFLKMDGIKGEAQDSKHKDSIDILAWSWGLSNSGTSHVGGGSGSGKANFQDISCTKYIDFSSTFLMTHCATGKHIKECILTVRKAGETPLEYIKMTMTDCLVTSLSTGGSGGEDRLTENLSINFAKVNIVYVPQDNKGAGAGNAPFNYDIAANKV